MRRLIFCFLITVHTFVYGSLNYGNLIVDKILNVYDGDTFRVDIDCDNDVVCKNIAIRINGIDTPELRDKNKEVRKRAIEARNFLEMFLRNSKTVELRNINRGKYFRLVADVYADGTNIGNLMIKKGYAVSYYGETKPDWKTIIK